ncbi:MAG: hypothetical protein U5K55_14755 [Aliarcobacter sp.]|nr:hypothetical protein [Aliarcobacter sp.]
MNNNKDCVLNQNYTYYNYICNNGYSPVNSGGSCNLIQQIN